MRLEALNISAQVLVLIGQLRVEVLREIQVTLHVIHFAIPEVQLVPLLRVVLLHKSHATSYILFLTIIFFESALEVMHSVLQGLLVSVEGCAQRLSSLTLFLRSDFL